MLQEDVNHSSHSFSKKERICSKKVLESLLEEKNTLFIFPFKCYFRLFEKSDNAPHNQIAISIPKKKIPLAVHRNRIKRLIRESYRLNKVILNENIENKKIGYQILFIFVDNKVPSFDYIENKIIAILKRLSKSTIELS
ncbi:MAG TPA: ribonuclease P protein component [Bacteroidales bacterium]|jgi:ribonuclease P protein component|nr:ribonuclease P protein component [Bacteroidales bacterium]HOS57160.1 ribonuclease P protein component [Bacteroidales bacterium]HRT12998.1 ribonuclease P protein component [Bacteroidales bacterium]HXK73358.1 ribonuclease P protein component [Bacteroidales bacterium]